ncbi:M24 family metallopeptidase [Parahaliea aestuarii]|uniref:M24 family metallopeptidase n=1 Tax=Parahaliea aestuarii TaxID=1852021 RepID=A0A5C9A2I0_9GAMM|nr:M24 family metallopeptidase [Parahaliea aestuarii]TXS94926.1 M24 family metallopeptidase [Parahaliea aestuarii]
MIKRSLLAGVALLSTIGLSGNVIASGEAQRRWEFMNQIRQEKFDLVLPEVMRENGVDMWITVNREGFDDPLTEDFGKGYVGGYGYYIFTDRGNGRIERAVLGVGSGLVKDNGAYDIFGSAEELSAFVQERDPKSIALNFAPDIGAADGLSHTSYQKLSRELGPRYAGRFVSAQKLASDFRSRRVATEIAGFARAGEMSRTIAERAFSNEVITPGKTTLADVAWWMREQQFENNLGTSFGLPSVYVTGPDGVKATSNDYVIQRGDFLAIDWGVGYLNFYTDIKRHAYVLKEGETHLPESIQRAFDNGITVRDILKAHIKAGRRAGELYEDMQARINDAGFRFMDSFNSPTSDPDIVDVIIGCHSVGNLGHGIGPSIAWFNPERMTYTVKESNLLSIELFAYTAIPEWGGRKLRIPLEDDAVVTARGVEWLYPVNQRVRLIR